MRRFQGGGGAAFQHQSGDITRHLLHFLINSSLKQANGGRNALVPALIQVTLSDRLVETRPEKVKHTSPFLSPSRTAGYSHSSLIRLDLGVI